MKTLIEEKPKHLKTENFKHKSVRTQIITQVVGFRPVPLFGQWTFDEKGKVVPKTWDAPILKRSVIHHSI